MIVLHNFRNNHTLTWNILQGQISSMAFGLHGPNKFLDFLFVFLKLFLAHAWAIQGILKTKKKYIIFHLSSLEQLIRKKSWIIS